MLGATLAALVPHPWCLSVSGVTLEADCVLRIAVAAPAALAAAAAVGIDFLLLALHPDPQAACPQLSLWAAARCHMELCATCLAAAVVAAEAVPHAVQCMQDGEGGIHRTGVAIQAAEMAEEIAQDAAAAAHLVHGMQHETAELCPVVAAAAVLAAAQSKQLLLDCLAAELAAGVAPQQQQRRLAVQLGVATGAAAHSEDGSVLPAAEEAAVMTQAAAEGAGVLAEEGARCCLGFL